MLLAKVETQEEFGDLKLWWEVGKAQIQVFCQKYSSSSTAKLMMAMVELEANIKYIEMGVHTGSELGKITAVLDEMRAHGRSFYGSLFGVEPCRLHSCEELLEGLP